MCKICSFAVIPVKTGIHWLPKPEQRVDKREKRKLVETMLSKGDTMICLDSRHPGVKVPDNHLGNPDLRLVLNLNFRHSISTLPEGIQAELLFGGVPFLCWIPYESLWAVYSPQTGEGYLWPGQGPVSLRDLVGDRKEDEEEKGDPKHLTPLASPERSIDTVAEFIEKTEESPKAGPSSSSKERDPKVRSRFRVIKGGKKD